MIKKVSYIFIIVAILVFSGCNKNNYTENPRIVAPVNDISQESVFEEHGVLTAEEKDIFSQIALTPDFPFIYDNSVSRYYKIENGEKIYIFNEINFSKKDELIIVGGKKTDYVYYDLRFTRESSEITVNFNFSQGTGYHGNGSIIKYGDKTIKSYIACGTEGCSKEVIE